ncbi:MAG: pyridoxal phosphate-dependent aminotransferase, partial [Candidatus Spyradosoma sp.]
MHPQKRIWLSPPHLTGRERDVLAETLASGWVAPAGANLDAFERAVVAALGGGERHAVAVN